MFSVTSKSLLNTVSSLDVHPQLAQYFPQTTYSCDYIQSIPLNSTTIILPDWTCNEVNYTTFDFSRFADLEQLEIGNSSFSYVETFIIDGLNNLTTLSIGKNSFTESKSGYDGDDSKSFHIKDCESLESISIGMYSFSDYSGEFQLMNLPSLIALVIGDYWNWSPNFFFSPFVLRGIYIYVSLDMIRFAEFRIY